LDLFIVNPKVKENYTLRMFLAYDERLGGYLRIPYLIS
jgi:hypothetical protein